MERDSGTGGHCSRKEVIPKGQHNQHSVPVSPDNPSMRRRDWE